MSTQRMSSNPEVLNALDKCIERLENTSDSEQAAFANDYWQYFEQRQNEYAPGPYDVEDPLCNDNRE